MTRARDDLWLHVPLRYHHHRQNSRGRDGHGYAQRSRFLSPAVVGHRRRAAPPIGAGAGGRPRWAASQPARAEVDDFLAALLA